METQERKTALSIQLKLALVALQFFCMGALNAQETSMSNLAKNFNGDWWEKANSKEKVGFLYALDDCLTFDASPSLLFSDTWDSFEKKITDYYGSAAEHRQTSVEQIFKGFGRKQIRSASTGAGERYGNEFWRAHDDAARRGFLEGYISCRSDYENSPKWSKPVSYYMKRLNDMYNADDRHGENFPEYDGSIESALKKLQD